MRDTLSRADEIDDIWLKPLLESSGNVVFKYGLLPERRFLYVSPNVETLFGFSVDEHLQNPDLPLTCVCEDDRLLLRSAIMGADSAPPSKPLSLRWRCKNGHIRQTLLYLFPIMKNGQRVACYGLHADISEQLEKRAELEIKAQRLDAITAHAEDLSWACDMRLTLTHASAPFAALLGYEQPSLCGRDLNTLLTPASRDLLRDMLEKLQLAHSYKNAAGQLDLMFQSVNGLSAPQSTRIFFLCDAAGQPLEMLGLGSVATSREKGQAAEENASSKILQAQKLESLGILAGGIAHDFNNLLVGILGNASLALTELPSYSTARRSLLAIEQAAKRAAELANQMLAYSGKGRFVMQPVQISRVIEEMQHLLGISLPKSVVLKYYLSNSLPPVMADVSQLQQILMNLVTNAGEAIAQKSGVVTIVTGVMECDLSYLTETYLDDDLQAGYYVYLEVSDTGCGMPPEVKTRVFDPFFSTKFMGRGLGLAAVLGIVRGHHGAIKVYSENGRGTTFKVLLPIYEGDGAWLGRENASNGATLKHEGTILVVDDEESVRAVAKRMLVSLGYDVLCASDGLKGIELFRENMERISAVILDIAMPHLSGEETFRELRRIKKDAFIILSSGYNAQEVTSRFGGRDLSGFIQKPYSLDDLSLVLHSVLTPATPPEPGPN